MCVDYVCVDYVCVAYVCVDYECVDYELRRTQARRHLESDTSSKVFELVVNAPNRNAQRAFYPTIVVFLAMDDDTLWTRARTMEFPEFE